MVKNTNYNIVRNFSPAVTPTRGAASGGPAGDSAKSANSTSSRKGKHHYAINIYCSSINVLFYQITCLIDRPSLLLSCQNGT